MRLPISSRQNVSMPQIVAGDDSDVRPTAPIRWGFVRGSDLGTGSLEKERERKISLNEKLDA